MRGLPRLRALVSEAHRRRVWGVVVAYATGAFVVAQVADIAFPALGLPPGTMTVLVILLIAGLVLAFVLPWAYDLTPAGLKRTPTLLSDVVQPRADWWQGSATPATPFLGRKRELRTLEELVHRPDVRLLSIVGPGGIGKSRLAVELARRVASAFPDGVVMSRLDTVDSRDGLATELAVSLGISSMDMTDRYAQVCGFLKSKSCLLILDGCEQLLSHGDAMTGLLGCSPSSSIVVTSRDPLSVRSEHLFTLGGMSWTPEEPNAQTLFTGAARRRIADFEGASGESDELTRICAAVEGMPLAIELAAAWVGTLSLEAIRAELESGDDLLEARTTDYPQRQQSVGTVLDSTWRRLPPGRRENLTALALFEGSFTLTAAETVARMGSKEVAALVERSLVRPEGENGRLRLSRVVRTYCRRKTGNEGLHEAARRHARLFRDTLLRDAKRLGTRDSEAARQALQLHHGDIVKAFRWHLCRGNLADVSAMADPLRRFLDLSGRFQDGQELFSTAAESARRQRAVADSDTAVGVRRTTALLRATAGFFAARLGSFGDAARTLEEAIGTLARDGEGSELAFALNSMGDVLGALGRYEEAGKFCSRAYELFVAARDDRGISATANNLGVVAQGQGDHVLAADYYEESLRACERLGDRHGVAVAENNLGVLAHDRGDLEQARRRYEAALAVSNEVSDRDGEASALANLARVAYAAGSPGEVDELASRARAVFQEIGNVMGLCACELSLGDAALLREDLSTAGSWYTSALGTAFRKRAEPLVGEAMVGLATVALEDGDTETAYRWVYATGQCESMDQEAQRRRDATIDRLRQAGFERWETPPPLLQVAREMQHNTGG